MRFDDGFHRRANDRFAPEADLKAASRLLQTEDGGLSYRASAIFGPGEVLQFGDNFIDNDITDLRQFKAGDPPRSYWLTGSICRENTDEQFRG
jgi:hypothetical protein